MKIVSLVGRGIRIDCFGHSNGEDWLIVTTRRDGRYESGWGFEDSQQFYMDAGLVQTQEPVSAEVQAIMVGRIHEADDWPILSKKAG